VSRLYVNVTSSLLTLGLEELLHDILSVFEVGVVQRQLHLDVNVVVLIVLQAKPVSLQHFSAGHASVANVHLTSLGVANLASTNNEIVLFVHVTECLIPDDLALFLCENNLLLNLRDILGFGFFLKSLGSEGRLLSQDVHIIVTVQTT